MTASLKVSHENNLDFLRLFFSLSVLITHSYALSGLPEHDALYLFSKGQAVFSHTGVQGFLIISGYLITKSLLRSASLTDYYFKRILRVFPALIVVVCFTAIICFFFSTKSFHDYFFHYSFRDYIFFNTILKTQLYLNGVFTTNPYPSTVNGSLWTIPYEFFFYIVLSFLFFIRFNYKLLRWLFLGAYIISATLFILNAPALHTHELPFWRLQGDNIAELGAFFLSGAIWAVVPLPSTTSRRALATCALIVLLASLYFGGYRYIQFMTLPILVISFGTLNARGLSWARKYGDFSYGIYLWGFLVQQILMHFFRLNVSLLMLTSVPITYLCGVASWFLIEKKALRYKMHLPASTSIAQKPTS